MNVLPKDRTTESRDVFACFPHHIRSRLSRNGPFPLVTLQAAARMDQLGNSLAGG
jgi:hypothetical protein